MRITNKVMNNNMLRNLNSNLRRLDAVNQQLASGKKVQFASDDPVGAGSIMRLRSSLHENEQYLRNVDQGISWLDATDSVLKDTTTILHRARELTVYGASDTLDGSARKALADEIDQLFENVFQLSNSTHAGRQLFGGQETRSTPFEVMDQDAVITYLDAERPGLDWDVLADDPEAFAAALADLATGDEPLFLYGFGDSFVQYTGGFDNSGALDPDNRFNTAALTREIGVNADVQLNLLGNDVFGEVFTVLAQASHYLKQGDSGNLATDVLGKFDETLDSLLGEYSDIGAKTNRLELAKERLADLKVNLTALFSESHDVDVAEAIMHLKAEENTYRTALSVGARIIQPSLVDFLR